MREWKPGDVAAADFGRMIWDGACWHSATGLHWTPPSSVPAGLRLLAVIDPEDDGSVRRLTDEFYAADHVPSDPHHYVRMQAALRSLIEPPKPEEPTDPKVRVTDRRDNIWRLLADGDWVCTSGPDIGEYIDWDRLAADRGPLGVTLP